MTEATVERLILVVDANPDHVRAIATTLNEGEKHYHLKAIASGSEALDFLHRQGAHSTAPRPDLILLDPNLPDADGLSILAAIKGNSQLRRIPIIVFTVNDRAEDIFRSYTLQGNCYVLKSDDLQGLSAVAKRIEEFWLQIVTLPGE
jgi:chemotaxis family two-component system response regulator Rcp1